MPHKAPLCPKCGGRTRQVKFLRAAPNISDYSVERGFAKFRCRYCKHTFESFGGINRLGAKRTYAKYKGTSEDD